TAICDQPFPFSIKEIADIEIVGNDVFAGGIGLFRFSGDGWSREPDSNGYIVSLGFASPTEGWAATAGLSVGLGGAASSSENTLGHWTNQPSRSRVARWPQPNSRPLQSVAVNPNGIALAVGDDGAVLGYIPEAGWDVINSPSPASLHAVAWSSPTTGWIVGAGGTILRVANGRITEDPESARLTKASLFGITFASPTDGVAVGTRGTILRFDGTRWTLDPASSKVTDRNLYSVSSNKGIVAAAGSDGAVIERRPGNWVVHGSAASASTRSDGKRSNLNAISVLNDGTIIAGGSKSALIAKNPSGDFHRFNDPLEGNVLAVGGWRDSSGLRIFASLDPDVSLSAAKFSGDRIVATRSVLMFYDGSLWRDLSLNRQRRIYAGATDTSAFVDPILAVSVEGPTKGWAVGGIPAIAADSDHLPRTDATSSIYRFDSAGEPKPAFERATVSLPRKGHNFAFFSDTWCSKGPCGMTMGTGTHADLVALRIREEIGHVSSIPGGPDFTMFGGNGRVVGIPEELAELSGFLLSKFPTPVFGAIGNHDLFGGLGGTTTGQTIGGVGSTPGLNFFAPDTTLVEVGSHDYWQQAFGSAPAPWGDGERPSFIDPVDRNDIPTLIPPTTGLGRTHYAFDYISGGRARFRVVVVDSSARSYGKSSDQNPVNEDQRSWLPSVLSNASLQNLPTIVVMNQPTLIPDRTTQFNWKTDQDHFTSQVAANRVSAVLTGGARWNVKSFYGTDQANVPGYLMGTGGAPLGYDPPTIASQPPSLFPSDGYYNSWFVVNVDPTAPAVLGERLPGQAAVSVLPFPILDFISIRSIDGTSGSAGSMLRFTALAKSLTGGLADGTQSKATYIPVGDGSLIDCPDGGQGYGACAARDQIDFPYRFYSENPSVADFVVPAIGGDRPLRDANNKVVRDPTGRFGLLCTFNIGSAYINIESGLNRDRKKVTVGGGFGPCVDAPVIGPAAPNPFAPPVEQALPAELPNYFRPPHLPPLDVVAVVLPPAPGPIIAPAPPASAASSRKEKREAELEQQGEDGESTAEARRMIHSKRSAFDSSLGYGLLASAILFGLLGAIAAGSVANRRNLPAFARIHID
ncbi:MAG TPA: hypothetical protein VNA87_01430, partial [Actinomycetota bacterium]|nr:hypothetical protein [Actinomycetota bacterium]